jgi:hypothetical protein
MVGNVKVNPKMSRLLLPVLVVALFLVPLQIQANSGNNRLITMIVPDRVLAEALKRVLPLNLNGTASGIEGTITLVDISNFRSGDQKIRCHLDLQGTNLHLVTRVVNQEIRLKLGSSRVDFDCHVSIRYDAARQTLFIRPTATDVHVSNSEGIGDIEQALILLVNGREFPVTMQHLTPIIAETSDKIITIGSTIVDVRVAEGAVEFSLAPAVTTQPRKQPAPVKGSVNN